MLNLSENEIGSLVISLEQKNKSISRLELSLASALGLVEIRDRKIKLLEEEIALLKKILAGLQNTPRCDSGQDKWPVGCQTHEKDRAELETEGYPKYNELSGGNK